MAITKEQKEIIEMYYPTKKPSEVAALAGMKKVNIIAYAHRHGISNNRYWSKKDTEFLVDRYGAMTAYEISRRLRKPYRSVIDKINKMKIGNFTDNMDGLHLADVSRLVGRDKETIKCTWVRHGLKIYKKGRFSIIKEKDLAKFMKENPERWDATQCEYWFFNKYDWYRDKRLKDRDLLCNRRYANGMRDSPIQAL